MLMPCTKSAPDFSGKIRELLFNSELKIEQTRIMYDNRYEPIRSRMPEQYAATVEFISEYFNVQSIETGKTLTTHSIACYRIRQRQIPTVQRLILLLLLRPRLFPPWTVIPPLYPLFWKLMLIACQPYAPMSNLHLQSIYPSQVVPLFE